jgi:quinol monooxygenase YgiN
VIHVVVNISVKPGMLNQLLEIFKANACVVRTEKGCIEYGAFVDAEDAPSFQRRLGPDSMMVFERWESMKALADHANSPHVIQYRANVKNLVISNTVNVFVSA